MTPAVLAPHPTPALHPRSRCHTADPTPDPRVFLRQVTWEDGLKKTVDWYLANGFNSYWEHGDVEQALKPHPGAAYVQTKDNE